MEINKNWKVKDIKEYLNFISLEKWGEYYKEKQLEKIMIMLDALDLSFTKFRSINGYNIIEVHEMYFIIETEKKFVLVEISENEDRE